MDQADKIANVVIAAFLGILISAPLAIDLMFGLLINETSSPWWSVGVMAGFAVSFGTLGLIYGDCFISWMSNNLGLFANRYHDID